MWSLLLLGSHSTVKLSSSDVNFSPASTNSSGNKEHTLKVGNVFEVLSGSSDSEGSGVRMLPPDTPCGEMHVLEVSNASG